ncbi:restriction endonuclease subunit S [Pseudomonas helleri]|uniref:Restriction endonuclease subunit S n=1 Tax=Pseudomonas helleri TaxID=1608996 RepID=A0A7X1XHI1_9PSED|nr:restriction endonuclease subunit S [Pseudomonas helleri]MQT91646.1 restriction endonuclease subunit S [Pseudomonas helleri]
MSSEWIFAPLENCLDALIDYRGKTPEKTSAGIPLITAKIIKGGRIEKPTEFIAADNYDSWMRRGIPQEGDVVLTVEAPLGEVAQLGPEKIALAQRVVTLRGKKGILDNSYLLYLLQTEEMLEQLKSRATGTTVLGIKQSELRKVPLSLPPINQQKTAAQTLKTLDDRISLLRDTNATLEAIARALFKSWFVNFDPVRAKVEGLEPEGMDAITAALFPDSFEESELGLVPRGWRVGQIGDELRIAYGKNLPTTRLLEEGFPVFGGNGQIGFFSEYLYESRQVIVACRGAASGKINQSSPKAFVTNNSLILEKTKNLPFSYLKGFMKNSDLVPYVTGSAQPQVTIDNLKVFKILVPTESVVTCFESIAGLIEDQIEQNNCQAQTLTQLRDTLLPRLISGQLLLPEVEASVENMLSEAV